MNCDICTEYDVCDTCSSGYYKNSNDPTFIFCSDECIDNCLSCSDDTTCDTCDTGYYVDGSNVC